MKAYRAYTVDGETHEVVFAETASKARSTAFGSDGLGDAEFIEIKVARCKEFDQFFDAKCLFLKYDNIDVQRAARIAGSCFSEDFSCCDWCGLYQYDDLPESQLGLINESDVCLECRNSYKGKD